MKNITLLLLIASTTLFAQKTNQINEESFTRAIELGLIEKVATDTVVKKSNIKSEDSIITYYSDRASLTTACTGTLVLEDFAGGPESDTSNTGCDGDISEEGDSCFPASEIQPGIVITSSATDYDNYMVFTPAGFASNIVDVVGTNQFESFTIINFPEGDVNTVALDFHSLPFGNTAEIRLFGVSGLIDTVEITDLPGPVFFGFIASEPILSIEFQDYGGFVEMVGQVAFGSCEEVTSTNFLENTDFNYFPNPINNKLTISANKSINSVNIINVFGQKVLEINPFTNETIIDTSSFNTGTYFIKAQINNKIVVFNIIKE